MLPPSITTLFFSCPGTRALNQTHKTNGCNPPNQLPLREISLCHPSKTVVSYFLLPLHFPSAGLLWAQKHVGITQSTALKAHRYATCSARTWGHALCSSSKSDVATVSQTVLKWAGRHFDPQDPWGHAGQQVLQRAHRYCCSAPVTPSCLGCNWVQGFSIPEETKWFWSTWPTSYSSLRLVIFEYSLWLPSPVEKHLLGIL